MSKKLTRRKKLIIGIAVPLLVLVIVACVFLFGGKKGATPVKPEDSISICLTPPSSGAPSEYGGLENIGYIAGKLRLQPYYHSEMNGSVDAMVTQEVHGYKDYKDGIYIASSISIAHSSLAPSKALQKFFGDGKAVIRTAASDDEDDWNGAKTKWSTGEPNEILTREQYEEKYGMWGNELTDYIINSETLLSCSTPQKGADGIYTMTAELDPVKSTYYYTHQMLTMGELSEHPKFESIRLTFRFREDWTLLSYDIHEKYETYVSVITAECEAKMTITYSYEESKVDVSAYDNYFKKYANAAPVVLPEPEKGAREYLTAAFGPLLGGEKCIDFTANVNENVVAGKIALDISLGESIAFNGLQINLGNLQAGLVGNDIVVQYKDFNGKFPLETLLSYLGAGAAETPAIDAEALLGDLMNAPIVKDGDKSSISATLALGDFPIHIAFYFNEGTEITLEKIEASLELEGMPISLTATLGEKTDFVELDAENAIDVSPFVQDILAIIAGKNYAISVNYANADFAIAGEVVINAQSGLAVGAELVLSVNGGEIPVSVVYKDETVYVSCKGLQVQGTVEEISGLISQFVPQTASEVELDTATLVDALLKTNFDKLLKSLRLTENSVGIVVDGNELLGVLEVLVGEVEIELGDITLGYARESKTFAASVLGVELGMTATEKVVAVPENADTYVSVTEVVALVEEIISVIETKNYAISVNYANADFAIAGEVVINAQSGLAVGAELVFSVNGGEIPVSVVYKDETVYVSCKGLQVKGTVEEISGLIARFVPQTASEVELDTATLVDALLKANYDKLLKSLSLTENSVGIVIDGNELLTVLSAIVGEVEIELGDITLGYARESKTFAASVLGVELGMTATEKVVEIPVNATEYVSVTEVVALVEEIISVIETKNYAISVNYANADFAIAGEVVINAQSELAVGAELSISVNGGEIPVSVVYKDETVYVSCKGLQVKGTLDEISGLIARFVPQTASEVELDTATLVDALLKANYDKLLKSLSLTENSVGIVVDGNELLTVLSAIVGEVEFELGDITLGYVSETQSFAASVLGVELGMTATEKAVEIPVNATEYVTVTEVVALVEEIISVIETKNYAISVNYANADFAIAGEVVINAQSGIAVGADITISVNGGEIPVSVVYKDETVYVSCKGLQVQGTLEEISGLIARFVPQTASEVELDTATLVDALLKTNFDKLLKSLSLTENSVGIVIDGNELLTVLSAIVGEVEIELGDITLGYARESKTFAASVLGVELGMTATEKVVEIPVNATEYVTVTEIAQFIDPIMALTQAQNIGFGAALKTEIEGISLGVSLSGYVTLGEEISLYVQADVTVNEYAERLEIYYKEGGITVVYGGVALVVPENEISLIAETLTKVLGGQESALMVLTEDSVDIVAILESVKLYSESEGLGAFIKLSALLDMDISDLTASLSVKENWLFVKTDSLAIEGFAMQDVQLSIGALETVSEPDFAEVPVCTNVLEFALGAYRAFADTEYLGLDVAYASDELKLSIGGVVQFKAEENSTASIISMDVGVVIETYAYNEENGAYEAKENHFLHATILNEQIWISYSLKEIDAPTAVYVTLPVSELFVAGGKILPILAPMLGISEDVYYYDFVVKILSGAYKSFTTDIIDTMTLGEWLSLIEGIIAEQSATPAAAEETTQETSFVWTKDENGDTVVAINAQDVTVSLTMLKNAATELVAPSAPEGKSYLDISSIATLLTDVLNAYDYKDDGYALSGSLALSVGSWDLKNIQLSLQIQAVEKFALYANLVPKSGTVTQLAIEDGYVYMKRVVQSTETKLEGWKLVKYNVTTTEYRAMTMAQFSEDMMEQIYFILNLSSLEKGIIDSAMKNAGSSGGDTTSSQYDAGDMVKGFVYTPATDDKKANYKVTLNLGAILNDSAFGDVSATITREQVSGKNYYDLTKIDATVGISVLSFNLSLTHDSAIDPSKLDLSKIGALKTEALSGLGYSDFNALYAAVENGIVSKSSQVKVKA